MSIHALDLPLLKTKPSQAVLAATLASLVQPAATFLSPIPPALDQGTAHWLTRLIAADLSYLEDADAILDQASALLSASCGRQAMPAMTRSFHIGDTVLQVHEPTLTGDSLGLKTWATSFLVSQRLNDIFQGIDTAGKSALELGAGTGLVGLAAHKVLGMHITLSDYLPEILNNLTDNAVRNDSACQTVLLDWTTPQTSSVADAQFDIVLASDFLYAHEHAGLVASMLTRFVRLGGHALLAYPLRASNRDMIAAFHDALDPCFHTLKTGSLHGYDDWGGEEPIECHWLLLQR